MDFLTGPSVAGYLIVFFIFIALLINGGDMGTHSDTGMKVKSLNTSDGKRNRQRRHYYKKKMEEILDRAVDRDGESYFASDEDKFLFDKYKDKYDQSWE